MAAECHGWQWLNPTNNALALMMERDADGVNYPEPRLSLHSPGRIGTVHTASPRPPSLGVTFQPNSEAPLVYCYSCTGGGNPAASHFETDRVGMKETGAG